MKLREALELIRDHRPSGPESARYLLACSSTASHLQALLHAYLLTANPDLRIQVDTTLYGDLLGSIEGFDPRGCAGIAVLCEWYDLDPRLGYRRLGGWAPSHFHEILTGVRESLARLRKAAARLGGSLPVVISLPTLPLPPLEISTSAQALELETRLCAEAWNFAADIVSVPGVRLLSVEELNRLSPPAARYDARGDLSQGMPYRLPHASALSGLIARLLKPAPPLKGLITDLDDTLWDGIVGEVGVAGIGFTLETGAQAHGLYQQFLQSLSERGVLLAIASKNDSDLAQQALARPDLLVRQESFYPREIHWGPKSESIERILQAWNIGPEAIAYVDDSPLEIAEVQERFPQARCLAFPKHDAERLPDFFHTLRDWFGKPAIYEEDRIRAQSLRLSSEQAPAASDPASQESFLASLEASLTFEVSSDASDARAFELINKTNQFNLNGGRVLESSWREFLCSPGNFLLTVSYTDKFGPLGKIAVLMGSRARHEVSVSTWVMSCRAFSRRIEYATLRYLFERLQVSRISFAFEATDRNGPLRQFLADLGVPASEAAISRADFDARCPRLSHRWEESTLV